MIQNIEYQNQIFSDLIISCDGGTVGLTRIVESNHDDPEHPVFLKNIANISDRIRKFLK